MIIQTNELSIVMRIGFSNNSIVASSPYIFWNFTTHGGSYPVDISKIYITSDNTQLPYNTWFVSDGNGGWLTK